MLANFFSELLRKETPPTYLRQGRPPGDEMLAKFVSGLSGEAQTEGQQERKKGKKAKKTVRDTARAMAPAARKKESQSEEEREHVKKKGNVGGGQC